MKRRALLRGLLGFGVGGLLAESAAATSMRLLAAGTAAAGSLTYVNSYSAMPVGANPTIVFDSTGLAAGQWLLVFGVTGDLPGTFQTAGGTNFTPLATPTKPGSSSYYHSVYAVKLSAGTDISSHSFATSISVSSGLGNYFTVEVVSAPTCNTAVSYTDWVQIDGGQIFPAHAPITGSIGYDLLALQVSTSPPASGAFVSTPGTIRNDFGPNTTSGSTDAGHSSWGSYITPGANSSHTISGNTNFASFSGGLIEFGT